MAAASRHDEATRAKFAAYNVVFSTTSGGGDSSSEPLPHTIDAVCTSKSMKPIDRIHSLWNLDSNAWEGPLPSVLLTTLQELELRLQLSLAYVIVIKTPDTVTGGSRRGITTDLDPFLWTLFWNVLQKETTISLVEDRGIRKLWTSSFIQLKSNKIGGRIGFSDIATILALEGIEKFVLKLLDNPEIPSGSAYSGRGKSLKNWRKQLERDGNLSSIVSMTHEAKRRWQGGKTVKGQFEVQKATLCFKVLEHVVFLDRPTQSYLTFHTDLMQLCLCTIKAYETTTTTSSSSLGEVLTAALRVLINLTHGHHGGCTQMRNLGGVSLVVELFMKTQRHEALLGEKLVFDIYLLALSAIANCVEHDEQNRRIVSECCENDLKFPLVVLEFFYEKIRHFEKHLQDGKTSNSSEKGNSGWKAEDLVLAGNCSLLLGCLMRQHPENVAAIIAKVPEHSPKIFNRVLEAFVALHNQMDALTQDVLDSVLQVIKEFKQLEKSLTQYSSKLHKMSSPDWKVVTEAIDTPEPSSSSAASYSESVRSSIARPTPQIHSSRSKVSPSFGGSVSSSISRKSTPGVFDSPPSSKGRRGSASTSAVQTPPAAAFRLSPPKRRRRSLNESDDSPSEEENDDIMAKSAELTTTSAAKVPDDVFAFDTTTTTTTKKDGKASTTVLLLQPTKKSSSLVRKKKRFSEKKAGKIIKLAIPLDKTIKSSSSSSDAKEVIAAPPRIKSPLRKQKKSKPRAKKDKHKNDSSNIFDF